MNDITISAATIANAVKKQGRVQRRPSHDFYLRNLPWAIQPFVISPVLAGETMSNALLQCRAVTDPIKAPLIGWHLEFYLFYVKLRDLDIRDELTEMLLTPGADMTGVNFPTVAASWSQRLKYNGGINWMRHCLDRVVEEYFRDEGDDPDNLEAAVDGGVPVATFATKENYLDSVKLASVVPEEDSELPGAAFPADDIPVGFEAHYRQYEHMRALKLVDVTFEDYLKSFGVNTPRAVQAQEDHRPELIRYVRDWNYPTNTIDPGTGVPNSAVSWAIAERADKARFFTEPGFIFGVTVCRPKVYLGRSHGQAVNYLNDAYSWLPALMSDEPYTSLKKFAANDGPLGHFVEDNRPGEDYWVDMRDLFLYGDSFSNFWMDATNDQNVIARPSRSLERRYPTTDEAKALFIDAANKNRVRMDGVINFQIAGTQRDHT